MVKSSSPRTLGGWGWDDWQTRSLGLASRSIPTDIDVCGHVEIKEEDGLFLTADVITAKDKMNMNHMLLPFHIDHTVHVGLYENNHCS